jgi:hypothetical protein
MVDNDENLTPPTLDKIPHEGLCQVGGEESSQQVVTPKNSKFWNVIKIH